MSDTPGARDGEFVALRNALNACRGSFISAGFFSMFINILMLMPSLYMLQVYDRVLGSSSESTLLMLTLIAVFLFCVMGGLEWVRGQIMIAASVRLDAMLGPRLFNALFARTLASGGRVTNVQPLSDLLNLRQFLTGPGLLAFFDAPWFPIYIAVLFAFHWMLGVVAIFSAVVLFALTLWNERSTHGDLKEANQHAMEAANQTQRNLRNAEAIAAMGMLSNIRARWQVQQNAQLALQAQASRNGGVITSASKTFRQGMQSLMLGLGAYLALQNEISPGAIIAGSILLGRALAPLDQLLGSWKGFLSAREAYARVGELLDAAPETAPPMPLPAPVGEIALEKLTINVPGTDKPILKGLTARIPAGTTLAIIGPSGAGKSTLARALLGIMPPSDGSVRIDGAERQQWDPEFLGRHVGYLPQDVELLDGTVGENIARFGEVEPEKVVASARAAGVHELILRLPNGYDTVLSGNALSAGQRQRVGLARALYGDPQILLLDEPNSNLDQEGDAALMRALESLKAAGRTVLLITHRNNVLALADRILLLVDGELSLHGERDEVMAALQKAATRAASAKAGGARPIQGQGPAQPAGQPQALPSAGEPANPPANGTGTAGADAP